MPALQEIVRVLIVRTQQEAAGVFRRDDLAAKRKIVCRRPAADLHVHSARDLLAHLLRRQALVIGDDPAEQIRVERVARDGGRVSVRDLPRLFRRREFCNRLLLARDHGGVVHHLPQSEKFFADDLLPRCAGVERRAARLEGRGGNAGRELHEYVERADAAALQAVERLFQILRALHAAHVDKLVRVGDNAARPVRNGKAGELFGREHGTFHMNVRVQKPGQKDHARSVVLPLARVPRSDADDDALFYGDLALFCLPREHVEDTGVPNDEVAFCTLHRAVDERF